MEYDTQMEILYDLELEINLNDMVLVLEDSYETPLERLQKLVDSKSSELEYSHHSASSLGNEQFGLNDHDEDCYEQRISDEPNEGEFSSEEYI